MRTHERRVSTVPFSPWSLDRVDNPLPDNTVPPSGMPSTSIQYITTGYRAQWRGIERVNGLPATDTPYHLNVEGNHARLCTHRTLFTHLQLGVEPLTRQMVVDVIDFEMLLFHGSCIASFPQVRCPLVRNEKTYCLIV